MMVRPATEADLADLVALAGAMHQESPRFQRYPFLGYRLRAVMESVLDMGPRGFMVVAEQDGIVGGFVGVAHDHFACDVLQASDIGLFISPEHRGGSTAARLVRAYLAWAKGIDAEPTISVNTGVTVERTGQLLERLGAKNSGTNWTWGI